MAKFHNRSWGIVVLTMLATSSLTINFSYADNTENEYKITKSASHKAILTEQVIDGKLEVKRFSMSEDLTDADMNRRLTFEEPSGWAYVNYKTYQPGIVLYDGKASKMGESLWKISSNSSVHDKITESLTQNVHTLAYENTSDELGFKVIFTGKLTETNQDSVFTIAMMDFDLYNHEMYESELPRFAEVETHLENDLDRLSNSIMVG